MGRQILFIGMFFQQKKAFSDSLSIYIVYTKILFSCINIKKSYPKMESREIGAGMGIRIKRALPPQITSLSV